METQFSRFQLGTHDRTGQHCWGIIAAEVMAEAVCRAVKHRVSEAITKFHTHISVLQGVVRAEYVILAA